MNDLDTFKNIFNKSGIEFKEEAITKEKTVPDGYPKKVVATKENGESVEMDWQYTKEESFKEYTLTIFGGYTFFFTVFTFDENGTLLSIKAYE